MKHTLLGATCAGILIAASGAAQAALIDRGGGLIYDTDLNITWLADTNYARTSGYDADGLMTWSGANTWAENLNYYDSVRGVTFSDWRLPSSNECTYYNCTGSELGHMFYNELGGVAGQYIDAIHNANYWLFTNFPPGFYWTSASYAPIPGRALGFYAGDGGQYAYYKTNLLYAWAVRSGDVAAAASTVPVPAAAWLFGSGLLGLVGVSRKRRA